MDLSGAEEPDDVMEALRRKLGMMGADPAQAEGFRRYLRLHSAESPLPDSRTTARHRLSLGLAVHGYTPNGELVELRPFDIGRYRVKIAHHFGHGDIADHETPEAALRDLSARVGTPWDEAGAPPELAPPQFYGGHFGAVPIQCSGWGFDRRFGWAGGLELANVAMTPELTRAFGVHAIGILELGPAALWAGESLPSGYGYGCGWARVVATSWRHDGGVVVLWIDATPERLAALPWGVAHSSVGAEGEADVWGGMPPELAIARILKG